YAESRVPKNGEMSRHIQFEANMSLTGGNADKRVLAKPSDQKKVLAALYHQIVNGSNGGVKLSSDLEEAVSKAITQLKEAGDGAVVVSGIPETDAQHLVLAINEALNSKVINTETPRLTREGDTQAVNQLVKDMNAGKIGALLIAGVNPAYSLPNAEEFVEGLEKVDCSISFAMKEDETAQKCKYVATTPHYLESWGDVQFNDEEYSLIQPTIQTLFNTRQFQDSLLTWMDHEDGFYDYLNKNWEENILNGSTWNQALHDGVYKRSPSASEDDDDDAKDDDKSVKEVDTDAAAQNLAGSEEGKNFELTLYSSVGLGDGKQANNPWLQEFPDPITRSTWDNFITMSMADADKLD